MTEKPRAGDNKIPLSMMASVTGGSLKPAFRLLTNPKTLKQWPRLFSEGIDPIVHVALQANNTALINRWLNQGTKVTFLASYPRSGNTWVRFMLSDVILQSHGVVTTTELPVHPNDLIPEFRSDCVLRRLGRCPSWAFAPQNAVIKIHSLTERLEEILLNIRKKAPNTQTGDNAFFKGCNVLYLYRAPEDASVSFYHFCLREPSWAKRAADGVDAFCRMEVSRWIENAESFLRAPQLGLPVLYVSYERLVEKPAIVLDEILTWMGIPHDDAMVQRAISNMQFDKLQSKETLEDALKISANKKQRFFRRGFPGSGRDELHESTLLEIRERTAALMDQLNKRQMAQTLESSASLSTVLNPSGAIKPSGNDETRESKRLSCLI